MIRTDQRSFKNQKNPKKESPKKSQESVIFNLTTDELNSCEKLKSEQCLVNYPRWVLNTPQNRLVAKNYLINEVLSHKRVNLRYLPCCNIFYIFKDKKAQGHKAPVKASDLLLNNKEKNLITKFFKKEREKRPHLEYVDFRNQMIPELVEFIKSLELDKIDAFINSLPSNQGCFEFPLIRSKIRFSCVEKDLNKTSRAKSVFARQNLVLGIPFKNNLNSQSSEVEREELSPTGSQIRSLLTSSAKKLKTNTEESSSLPKSQILRESSRMAKQSTKIISAFKTFKDSAHGRLFDLWSQEVANSGGGVGFPDQGAQNPQKLFSSQQMKSVQKIKHFVVAPPASTISESPQSTETEEVSKTKSKLDFSEKNSDQDLEDSTVKTEAVDLNSSQIENSETSKIIEEEKEDNQPERLERPHLSRNEPLEENGLESSFQYFDQDVSDLGSQLLKTRMSELELLRQLKSKSDKRKQEVEKEAIEYDEKARKAQKYAQGLLHRAVARRAEAENLGKQSENLAFQIKEVKDKIQFGSFESSD